VTGLLGPSGAGKTTLLELLAGRRAAGGAERGAWSGALELDGAAAASPEDVRAVSGYVAQDDVLPGTLTVYEHLAFHAALRLPRGHGRGGGATQRTARVLEVIDNLGLGAVADSLIGDAFRRGISGGERRRVSIAAELLTRPPLLFLDEPTSGLDAGSALAVMRLVAAAARRGTAVVASLHQPRREVFDALGRALLLCAGEVAYFGPPRGVRDYFTGADTFEPMLLAPPRPLKPARVSPRASVSAAAGWGGEAGDAAAAAAAAPAPLLSWAGLSYSIRPRGGGGGARRREILRCVSGYAGGGAGVVGLMGASGAGKTTLLELLAGRKHGCGGAAAAEGGRASGAIALNGAAAAPAHVRAIAGYVAQDDVLPAALTVCEHLAFHAALRLPPELAAAARAERVLEVVGELGLGLVADSRIGDSDRRGISGGERRRLSIAAELLSRPPLLFLDEPTTGLDAGAALAVMRMVAAAARRGAAVVASLHQPRREVFDALGRVLLLCDGEAAFFGPPHAVHARFAALGRPLAPLTPNPADAML
ncbi:P-loop containing nucleoside triphosphate hydrolase protein, partial [Tribonema minus]